MTKIRKRMELFGQKICLAGFTSSAAIVEGSWNKSGKELRLGAVGNLVEELSLLARKLAAPDS